MQENKTATSDVVKYLKKHKKGLTQIQATELFGTTRLSSIIHELRHRHNMNIVTDDVMVKTKYGRPTLVARYRLDETHSEY